MKGPFKKKSSERKNVDEGVEVEEPTRLQKLQQRLSTNKHNRIENFGKTFTAILVSFLTLFFALPIYSGVQNAHKSLTSQALYTTQFQASKTNQTGTVTGVYTSKDHSKVLLMLKFDSPASMSSLAANYQAFLSGADQSTHTTKIHSHPSGSIIMFGQTGYMGLYLTNAGGFPQQIMSVIFRANKQLISSDDNAGAANEDPDPRASFKKYDQWNVFFNPAGRQATHIASLDAAKLNIGDVFYDTVLRSQEASQRNTLNTDLVNLNADMSSVQDYRTRLATTSVNGLHVKLPDMPDYINGDKITGQDASPGNPSTLELVPKKVFENGFNFDWRHKSIRDNILGTLAPKGQNEVTWFNNHMQASPESDNAQSQNWKMSDGSNLSDVDTTDVASLNNINSTVQSLTTAYSQYYTDKEQFQSTDLGAYLGLELQLLDVVQNNNINSTGKAIRFF